MSDDFHARFAFQLHFARAIMRRVGPHLLRAAPITMDLSQATDFLMLDARDRRIAARIRRRTAVKRSFRKDITFRSWHHMGARVEWDKIIEDGFAQWMFYGVHTGHAHDLNPWWILDLDVFRALHAEHGKALVHEFRMNKDGKTGFNVIRPGEIVRAYKRPDLLVDWEFDGHRHQTSLLRRSA